MASPIRANRINYVGFRRSTDLTLGSGTVTATNTARVFRANGDGTWSSYKPGRSINAFTSMTRARMGTQETVTVGSGNVYLVDALQDFEIPDQYPWVTVSEGSGSSPSANGDNVDYIFTIAGYDRCPNYGNKSGAIQVDSAGSGNWSAGGTWVGGSVPAAGTIPRIRNGHTVTVDGVISTEYLVISVENGGTLAFSTAANTELHAQTLQVRETGTLTMGTPASPIPNNTTATLVINDAAIDTTFDPNQYGNGLLVLGTFKACGYDRGPSKIRLSGEIASTGATTLSLSAAATNWQVGDRLIIPDTRHLTTAERTTYVPQWENRTISSKSGDNLTLTLNSALTYSHKGARATSGGAVEISPHVANLSRNVMIKSENAAGTRGHVLFTGHADIDVRNTLFKDLARTTTSTLNNTAFDGSGNVVGSPGTNQIGRYATHFHHCGGRAAQSNGYQFTFTGNAIDGGDSDHTRKWGVTVHGSHWGLVENNVVYNMAGGGFVLEDGTETLNLLKDNIAIRIPGNGANEAADDTTVGLARNGAGFWCRTGLSRYKDNIAYNCAAYGFVVNARFLGTINCPNYPGAHFHSGSTAGLTGVNGYRLHFVDFDGFECCGGLTQGAGTPWWVGSPAYDPEHTTPRGVWKNVVAWHIWGNAWYFYETCNHTLKDFVVRGDWARVGSENPYGTAPADYCCTQVRIENADIRAMYVGIDVSTFVKDNYSIKDCYINGVVGVEVHAPSSPGTATILSADVQMPRNVHIEGCTLTPASGTLEVKVNLGTGGGQINYAVAGEIYVRDRNGVSGADYRLYGIGQESGDILPANVVDGQIGCPEAGLTNLEAYTKYEPYDWAVGRNTPVKFDNPNPNRPGLCFANAIAPAGTTTPSWTDGLVETL